MKIKYVYTVESGYYSSYSIDAVFLSKEKAERYAEIQNRSADNWDESYVVERKLWDDSINMRIPLQEYYMVEMDVTDGHVYSSPEDRQILQQSGRKSFIKWEEDDIILRSFSTKSYDHALKIAQDKYYEIQANKHGIV